MGKSNKVNVVTVRLDPEEITKLDVHTRGQLSRSQVIRTVLQAFLESPEEEQRQFLVKRLFYPFAKKS